MAARECYVVMIEMEDQVQAMNIKEHRMVTEPTEKLEDIPLDNFDPGEQPKLEPSLIPRFAKSS